jgi:hypothetical protein
MVLLQWLCCQAAAVVLASFGAARTWVTAAYQAEVAVALRAVWCEPNWHTCGAQRFLRRLVDMGWVGGSVWGALVLCLCCHPCQRALSRSGFNSIQRCSLDCRRSELSLPLLRGLHGCVVAAVAVLRRVSSGLQCMLCAVFAPAVQNAYVCGIAAAAQRSTAHCGLWVGSQCMLCAVQARYLRKGRLLACSQRVACSSSGSVVMV